MGFGEGVNQAFRKAAGNQNSGESYELCDVVTYWLLGELYCYVTRFVAWWCNFRWSCIVLIRTYNHIMLLLGTELNPL